MDFKKEQYRKQKLKRAGARRVQKKKEIRLKVCVCCTTEREGQREMPSVDVAHAVRV